MRNLILTSAALLVLTGCTSERAVDISEWETSTSSTTTTAAAAPPLPPTNPANMANPTEFAQDRSGEKAYYFSTPSGRWQCAIVRNTTGCEGTGGVLNIAGAPDAVADTGGQQVAPSAIVVGAQGNARFTGTDAAQFTPPTAPAVVLPFNRTLAVAGFRCNIQESKGVSCLSEASGKGFTFSADGFDLQYSEVPPDAP